MIPTTPNWPFPDPGGPVPWTNAQIRAYAKRKLDNVPPAPI